MPSFTNEAIDIELLPKYESVILTKPHHSYWKVILINLSIFCVFIGGALVGLLLSIPTNLNQVSMAAAGFCILMVFLVLIYRASFKKRGYALRDKDIIFKSGIIAETTTIVPFNRIQHVSLDEGVFSRMLKLGKIQIYTAGGSSGHLTIAGIEIDKAKTIKDALLKKLTVTSQKSITGDDN